MTAERLAQDSHDPLRAARSMAAEPLTAEAFRPFGAIIERPRAAAEATGEAILALDGECVVYVALPAPEPDGFRAFRVAAGSGVVLDPGVWHGAPLAVDRPLCAVVLLPEGTGAEDTVVARFQDQNIEV